MEVINGKAIAEAILSQLSEQTRALSPKLSLRVILVGDDAASAVYVKQKEKAAARAGVDLAVHHFPAETNEKILTEFIRGLNQEASVTGFFIQLPLPSHLNTNNLLNLIDPKKDVDCLTPENLGLLAWNSPRFLPAAARAVEVILKRQHVALRGKRVVVVGRGRIAGLPVALRALHQDATVTIAHRQTKNLGAITRQADLLVSAVGRPGLIKADMVKRGAGVIDIGWARVEGRPRGDVDPEGLEEAARFYTPVPGGVGPITVACLLQNVVMAHKLRLEDLT
jgi:methylenetetrahydrofolate dehydrogenase (NADP+)/methenyltetrahydrofolate cyclohydrolase